MHHSTVRDYGIINSTDRTTDSIIIDIEGSEHSSELDHVAIVPHQSQELLNNSPRIHRLYEKMNDSKAAKFIYALAVSSGMAMYNYRKEAVQGAYAKGASSAAVSLACNILVSYEFCLKSPFLAAAVLSEIHKKPKLSLVVLSALIASGSLTAQLIHSQPATWAAAIGSSAFLNYAATRLSGLIDNDRSAVGNLAIGGIGLAAFSPLVCIWLGDTASLVSAPSIPKMIAGGLNTAAYASGTAAAALGALGSFITTLFYCQAIKGVPGKIKALYDAWQELLETKLSMGSKSSAVAAGFLALITAGAMGYAGYYSMTGFYVAILNALQCSSTPGELCWLTNAVGLSSAAMDFIATVEQILSGMVNTSAIIPPFAKMLKAVSTYSRTPTVDAGTDDIADTPNVVDQAASGVSDSNPVCNRLALCCCPISSDENQALIQGQSDEPSILIAS